MSETQKVFTAAPGHSATRSVHIVGIGGSRTRCGRKIGEQWVQFTGHNFSQEPCRSCGVPADYDR